MDSKLGLLWFAWICLPFALSITCQYVCLEALLSAQLTPNPTAITYTDPSDGIWADETRETRETTNPRNRGCWTNDCRFAVLFGCSFHTPVLFLVRSAGLLESPCLDMLAVLHILAYFWGINMMHFQIINYILLFSYSITPPIRIFEAFVISVLTYMIVAHLIRFFANHIAMNVKDPLACVNDPVPGPPSPVSWIVDICSHCLPCLRRVPGLDGVSTDPGSSGENLKESWKPLEGAQLKQLRSVMNKSRTLQVAGIAEQRVSGTWKLIEMAAAALTPIGNRRHSAVLCDHSI